jgi:hypothetical protein
MESSYLGGAVVGTSEAPEKRRVESSYSGGAVEDMVEAPEKRGMASLHWGGEVETVPKKVKTVISEDSFLLDVSDTGSSSMPLPSPSAGEGSGYRKQRVYEMFPWEIFGGALLLQELQYFLV